MKLLVQAAQVEAHQTWDEGAVGAPGPPAPAPLVAALPEPTFASEAPPAPSSRVCWALPALSPRSVVSKL